MQGFTVNSVDKYRNNYQEITKIQKRKKNSNDKN